MFVEAVCRCWFYTPVDMEETGTPELSDLNTVVVISEVLKKWIYR